MEEGVQYVARRFACVLFHTRGRSTRYVYVCHLTGLMQNRMENYDPLLGAHSLLST